MKYLAVMMVCAFMSVSAGAQGVDLTVWASWVNPTADEDEQPSIDFDDSFGFGAGANVFWSDRFSTELAVHSVEPDVLITRTVGSRAIAVNVTGINAISATAIAQYHFQPDARWSPYVGAGAAYALFDDVNDPGDLDELEINAVDFGEDYGFAVSGGVNWNFADRWRVNFDAKYVPVESDANIVAAQVPTRAQIGYSPFIASAGVTLRLGAGR